MLILTGILIIIFPFGGINAIETDSIYIEQHSEVKYYNPDSIFSKYNKSGYLGTIDDLHHYYEVVQHMTA